MPNKITWDQSLIKKYGSSNHYKLLNQLRTEVKKYPLNKNASHLKNENRSNASQPENISGNLTNQIGLLSNSQKNINENSDIQINTIYKSFHNSLMNNNDKDDNSRIIGSEFIDKNNAIKNYNISNISFNNSKNFSIYNNTNNQKYNSKTSTEKSINDSDIRYNNDNVKSTFNDRLNQVDMK